MQKWYQIVDCSCIDNNIQKRITSKHKVPLTFLKKNVIVWFEIPQSSAQYEPISHSNKEICWETLSDSGFEIVCPVKCLKLCCILDRVYEAIDQMRRDSGK